MTEQKKQKKTTYKREILEWGLIIGIPLLLYLTGLHTEVLGRLQQAVLWTGIIQPDTEMPAENQEFVSYDFVLKSMNGERITFQQFKGKVIFLNYWATWCPPCIAEMPYIQSLYEQYREQDGIEFVMVSLDEKPERVRDFIRSREFSFPVYMLEGRRPESLQSSVIPSTFVIDREGKIVTRKSGMANYNTDRFRKYLDKLISGQ